MCATGSPRISSPTKPSPRIPAGQVDMIPSDAQDHHRGSSELALVLGIALGRQRVTGSNLDRFRVSNAATRSKSRARRHTEPGGSRQDQPGTSPPSTLPPRFD